MAERDTSDFLTAFAVGAVLGIGAALLLRPEPKTQARRLLRQIDPYRKRIERSTRSAGQRIDRQARVGRDIGEQLFSSTRGILNDFRGEVRGIMKDARKEFNRTLQHQMKTAQKAARRTAKRVGI